MKKISEYQRFKKIVGNALSCRYPLKRATTMKIGGLARYFLVARNEKTLTRAIKLTDQSSLPWLVIGDGSNIIASDSGFDGLIIKNQITYFQRKRNTIRIGAGNDLIAAILKFDSYGLSGMENMAGIPGTIGGAICGCAGAYGQEIKDCLSRVKIFDGKRVRWISKKQCGFRYRESIFKQKQKWIILGAEFVFRKDIPEKLTKISRGYMKIRAQKYSRKILCPGSFFRNIVIQNIAPKTLQKKFLLKIDQRKIINGKVSAGYLLEEVGAKGMRCGGIAVASYHGNLVYNKGNGKSADVIKLTALLKKRVFKKFGITLEEEIQYI
ncbi:MAG: UDP-N-acetylmuramate dehydrogenase [Parcubacteria group bacterium]|nr:UDP-N-acetylmuramate dehydrogenase [Parcubacteria group bacterium]